MSLHNNTVGTRLPFWGKSPLNIELGLNIQLFKLYFRYNK